LTLRAQRILSLQKNSLTLSALERAWSWRQSQKLATSAFRLFHGPGEGQGALAHIAIDSFSDEKTSQVHYWITDFSEKVDDSFLLTVADFLKEKSAKSIVVLSRSKPGQAPLPPRGLWGEATEQIQVREDKNLFLIKLDGARHPGLFLDHLPLRQWLFAHIPQGARVLNTFCYTGSLSVAAFQGGAAEVTNLDLSGSYLKWSRQNWELNDFPAKALKCVEEDTLKYLPRLSKSGEKFDCVILDPPSFARTPGGTFSTKKDLGRLHDMAVDVLSPGGLLITSINSESISKLNYLRQVQDVFLEKKSRFLTLAELGQPSTFPTFTLAEPARTSGDAPPSPRHLKGWIFRHCP
jgi:23S rRNA G2069 N7-methylase RlmK/C1962 C5-methylase RlmI